MDRKALTYEEFKHLSEEEKCRRYCELSEEDRFRVRITTYFGSAKVPCNDCRHYLGYAKCAAFDGEIEREHMLRICHDPSTPCPNGYSYQPKDETSDA